ncbi:tail length tape measure protein [Arthrobacter phage Persistence]|uniref:Endolysin n=1 Tax=Arthrobacter phage Persistence TaxID=2836007 RepID=A0A8F3E612_9CAUD|nr:tail length tape measure protein [Arthrobacter phage Persistence]QWY79656.1 endolysin [Arthrobacter phage Persistence]
MRPVSAKFPVSQPFGGGATQGVDPYGNDPMAELVRQYGNYQPYGHAGEDIACPVGTPVYAAAPGTVLWADWGTNLPGDDSDWGYRQRWYLYKGFPGIVTVIQHPGWIGVYAHLSNNDPAPAGTVVKEGQLIAYSGNTGGVAPHLHREALVDLNYTTGDGLIYGRTNPAKYDGITLRPESATVKSTPAASTTKESEMPVTKRVDSTFKARHRLPKGSAYTLSVKDDGINANFAVNGMGHYIIHTYIRGEGLLPGQRIKAQFFLVKSGKASGHFEQDIIGTIDGTFDHPVVLNRAIEAGTLITCLLTSSNTETAYITGFGAEVTTWKA